MSRSLESIKSHMDTLYSSGLAYRSVFAFDRMLSSEIQLAVLELAGNDAHDQGNRVLDVGCGEGGIVAFWPHTNIVGIDLSEAAIDRARRKFPVVEYHAAPAEKLAELGLGSFGLVVAVESIEHWTDVIGPLRAIRNSMADGGALIITTPNRSSLHCRIARKLGFEVPYCSNDHIHEFEYDELVDVVTSSGFRHARAVGVHLAPYWAIPEFGLRIRHLTDDDEDVNTWLNDIGRRVPEYSFIQCHRFEAA